MKNSPQNLPIVEADLVDSRRGITMAHMRTLAGAMESAGVTLNNGEMLARAKTLWSDRCIHRDTGAENGALTQVANPHYGGANWTHAQLTETAKRWPK